MTCSACEAQAGKPGDVDPHDGLRGHSHHLRSDGVVETYVCRCGTRFQRFVAAKALGAHSGSWTNLP